MTILDVIGKDTKLRKVSQHEWAGSCPFCGGTDRLRVFTNNNKWTCRQCKNFHPFSLEEYMQLRGGYSDEEIRSIASASGNVLDNNIDINVWREGVRHFIINAKKAFWDSPDVKNHLDWWVNKRGLQAETLFMHDIGLIKDDHNVDLKLIGIDKKALIPGGYTIPCFYENEPVYVKIRTFNGNVKYKCLPGSQIKFPYCPGNPHYKSDFLVIVEGELDAMVLAQDVQTVKSASFGSAGIKWNLNFQKIADLYKKIYVLPDNDEAGVKHAIELIQNLRGKGKMIRHTKHKDITDMKLAGINLTRFILGSL